MNGRFVRTRREHARRRLRLAERPFRERPPTKEVRTCECFRRRRMRRPVCCVFDPAEYRDGPSQVEDRPAESADKTDQEVDEVLTEGPNRCC